MFKLIRQLLIAVPLLAAAALAFFYFRDPTHQRGFTQKSEQIRETFKRDKALPVWTGTVVVVDALEGDKALVNTENSPGVTVRLAGIDAPEMPEKNRRNGQPLAEESRDFLATLVKDRAVQMSIVATDVQKRPLVVLEFDGVFINEKVVQAGFAESGGEGFEKLLTKQKHAIENAELAAREKGLHIWSLTNYVRPVEFRIRNQGSPGLSTRN